MLERYDINPTQLTGILFFTAATIACFAAMRRAAFRDVSAWKSLAVINCLFLLEMILGLRHRIHDYFVALLMAEGTYGLRSGVQQSALICVAVIVVICLTFVLFSLRFAGGAVKIAVSLTTIVLTLFATEVVSLHALDAVYYHPIGPVLLIGWIWAIAATGIVLAAAVGRQSSVGSPKASSRR